MEHETPPAVSQVTSTVRPVWTYFLLPGAIIIAAILFSGNISIPGLTAQVGGGEPKTGTIEYGVVELKAWAKKVRGLDRKKFEACLDGGNMKGRVLANIQMGTEAGVTGTPTFFINGVMLVGAQPIEEFRKAIESATPGKNEVREDDHVNGEASAPVAIIEYSDFQCPYCRKFYEDTLPALLKGFFISC